MISFVGGLRSGRGVVACGLLKQPDKQDATNRDLTDFRREIEGGSNTFMEGLADSVKQLGKERRLTTCQV